MKAKLVFNLGSKRLELEGEGDVKTIFKAFSLWSNLPTKCVACKSTDIALSHKNPKGNDYYGLKCLACSAELNLGQHKSGGSLFIRHDADWEIRIGKATPKDADDPGQSDADCPC